MASFAVHYIEGKTQNVINALQFFSNLQKYTDRKGGAPISGARILYFTEMHGRRALPYWTNFVNPTYKGLSLPTADDPSGEPLEKLFVVYTRLLLVLGGLRDSQTSSPSHYLKHPGVIEQLPTLDTIVWLNTHAHTQLFLLNDFLELVTEPSKLVLNSERLWPVPPPLDYFNTNNNNNNNNIINEDS
eukprot:GHVR01001560.1.p1 GENE.GHVR01001560.1~~GHVR01001560.1.p1  ORF type:complete len:187 (-),score=43.05 GHVR01001560.1:378-938(-)